MYIVVLYLHLLLCCPQTVLWAIFTFYVQQKLLIPTSSAFSLSGFGSSASSSGGSSALKSPPPSSSKSRNHSKRIVTASAMWTLLHDFGVCPGLCSRSRLNNCLSSLQQPGQLPSVHCVAATKPDSDAMISFHSFQKVRAC